MEEDIKKEIVSEVKSNLEEFKSSLKERIKLPVLVTYCIILVLYNWDVLFYVFLQNSTPLEKIIYIKNNFTNHYYHRFFCPFILAIISTFVFPITQIGINFLYDFFKKKELVRLHKYESDVALKEKEILDIKVGNKDKKELVDNIIERDRIINNLKIELQESGLKYESKIEDIRGQSKNISDELQCLTSFITNLVKDNYLNDFSIEDLKNYHIFYEKMSSDESDYLNDILISLKVDSQINSDTLRNEIYSRISDSKYYSMIDKLNTLELVEFDEQADLLNLTEKGKSLSKLYDVIRYDL